MADLIKSPDALATAWINGNRSDVLDYVIDAHPYIAVAITARIRNWNGENAADRFQFALQRRWLISFESWEAADPAAKTA